MLCGYHPFEEHSKEKIYNKIKNDSVQFSTNIWDKISENAKNLIKNLL